MSQPHRDAVDASFTQQADAFEDERFIGRLVTEAAWVLGQLELTGDELGLDVAAGTGHAARGLAPHVRSVVAVDATRAMLDAGNHAARAAGLGNVAFMQGDACALPFVDDTFDVVVCRFALHHFRTPDEPLAELLRCARTGAQVMVADLIADGDPGVAAAQNALELLRDPSHARCLSAAELEDRLRALGAVDLGVERRETVRPLAPWLAQTDPTEAVRETITLALRDELAGGAPTGLQPQLRGDELWIEQRFAALTARAPG